MMTWINSFEQKFITSPDWTQFFSPHVHDKFFWSIIGREEAWLPWCFLQKCIYIWNLYRIFLAKTLRLFQIYRCKIMTGFATSLQTPLVSPSCTRFVVFPIKFWPIRPNFLLQLCMLSRFSMSVLVFRFFYSGFVPLSDLIILHFSYNLENVFCGQRL